MVFTTGKNKIKPSCFGNNQEPCRVSALTLESLNSSPATTPSAVHSPKQAIKPIKPSLDLELSIYEMLNIQTYLCSCQGSAEHCPIGLYNQQGKSPASFQLIKNKPIK